MTKITKRIVDTLRPSEDGKDIFKWDSGDGALKGFGIRIKPSGAASYIVQYRNKEGRTRRVVIGRVGVLTPEEAREEARQKLGAVAKGGDPSEDRHAARRSMAVGELCDWYLKEAEEWLKPASYSLNKSCIRVHIKPLLGSRAVTGLTFTDIEKLQADVAAGKTAKPREKGQSGKVSGGKVVAGRCVIVLGVLLEFAKRKKLITENPARGIRKYKANKRNRFLSFDEIKALGAAMREAEAALENKTALAAIRALLLTGCRKNEILALPWDWLDLRAQCIRFADTKTGAQLRPIGKEAARLFSSLVSEENRWAFPATTGEGHFVGLPRVLARVCKRAGLQGVTIHTLRHSHAAAAAELGFSELTIAGLLGHRANGVTARYAHVADSALLSAADRVSAYIADALDGKLHGEVIELNSARMIRAK